MPLAFTVPLASLLFSPSHTSTPELLYFNRNALLESGARSVWREQEPIPLSHRTSTCDDGLRTLQPLFEVVVVVFLASLVSQLHNAAVERFISFQGSKSANGVRHT